MGELSDQERLHSETVDISIFRLVFLPGVARFLFFKLLL